MPLNASGNGSGNGIGNGNGSGNGNGNGSPVHVSRSTLLEQTRQLAGEGNFSEAIFDVISAEWTSDLEKCGLVIAE